MSKEKRKKTPSMLREVIGDNEKPGRLLDSRPLPDTEKPDKPEVLTN